MIIFTETGRKEWRHYASIFITAQSFDSIESKHMNECTCASTNYGCIIIFFLFFFFFQSQLSQTTPEWQILKINLQNFNEWTRLMNAVQWDYKIRTAIHQTCALVFIIEKNIVNKEKGITHFVLIHTLNVFVICHICVWMINSACHINCLCVRFIWAKLVKKNFELFFCFVQFRCRRFSLLALFWVRFG